MESISHQRASAVDIARALGGRRSGRGFVAPCPAHQDKTPSLSVDTGNDGSALVHCHAGCSQSDVIAALKSRGLWPERERPEWTAEERSNWARQRREVERYLSAARYWRRGVTLLLESALDTEKAKLFNPTGGPADIHLLRHFTHIIERLQRAGDAALVAEYRQWQAQLPEQCAGIVQWARDREAAEIRAVAAYLGLEAA